MKLNILLLCNKPNAGQDANTITDHIEAIENYSEHNIWLYSGIGDLPKKLELDRFDIVIIHYSIGLLKDYYLSRKAKNRLREYKGLKVVFVQDEYRQINKMIDELTYLNIDALFTCFPSSEINNIYSKDKLPNVSKYTNLTGYIPKRLIENSNQPPICDRPLHVGYRGRELPFWYGELAYEKWNIVEKWNQYASREDLNIDISYHEKDRIYGKNWIEFLSSCKTTLGVESGASIMDFTGELEKIVDFHQLTYPNDSFHVVQKKYLSGYEHKHKLNQISPRCFEAIALKTVLVLYEGEYSGILIPGRHYIELKKDFSNIEDVLNFIRDNEFLQNMADVAYNEIALNHEYSYEFFITHVDQIISSEFVQRQKEKVTTPYEMETFLYDIKHIPLKGKLYKYGLVWYQKLSPELRLFVRGIFRPKSVIKYITKSFFGLLRPEPKQK